MWWEVLVNFMQEKCEMLKRHWLLQLVELEKFLFAAPPVPLVHSMETEGWIPEFLQTSLQLCSEAMLWIWQLSHLGDSEARRYILGSKASHVVSHFLLVLPDTGFVLKSSTEEEIAGTASVVLSVEDPQEL